MRMTTREILIRLAVAALLLLTIGAVGNLQTSPGWPPRPIPPRFRQLPPFRFDWLHHQWVNICGPFPTEICAYTRTRPRAARKNRRRAGVVLM